MGKSYVVDGAKLKCSFGDAESTFHVSNKRKVTIDGKPQGIVLDNAPNLNIMPFGLCRCLNNPDVAGATAANKGKLKKCRVNLTSLINGLLGKRTCSSAIALC